MARVLVTGATGFIGAKLTRRLVENGDEVTCLVRGSSKTAMLETLGVRLAVGDVRDAEAVRAAVDGAEVVYHLAGLTTAFSAEELMEINGRAFRNVAAACALRSTPPTLVSVSSLAAAGPAPENRPRSENDPPAPVSNYGRAKRAGELIAEEYAAQVPITIVRPPIVFGEGDLLMRNLFRSVFRLGIHVAFGVAYSRYSLIHVSDLVDALLLCAQRGTRLVASGNGSTGLPRGGSTMSSSQGYYFAASDEQPTFAELGVLIGLSLGRARVFVCRSSRPYLLWSAAAIAEAVSRLRGKPYIFNFDKAREAQAGSWTCSAQTIRAELGFAPHAPLIDRLRQTADWYRQQNLL
jgi:nucleoside-diphosphate-sugar epimerase